jgi:hypothetical protein
VKNGVKRVSSSYGVSGSEGYVRIENENCSKMCEISSVVKPTWLVYDLS